MPTAPSAALYLDQQTVDPGARLPVMASGEAEGRFDVVRLRGIDLTTGGLAYRLQSTGKDVRSELTPQAPGAGSSAIATRGPAWPGNGAWTWRLRVRPTCVDRGTILAWGETGLRLDVEDGRLRAHLAGGAIALPIEKDAWTEIEIRWNGALHLTLTPRGGDAWLRSGRSTSAPLTSPKIAGPLTFSIGFNGKIESPTLWFDGMEVAHWDFAADMTRQRVPGTGPLGIDLELRNAPRRAVTSSDWDGSEHRWTARPAHYGAIHFHDDDLSDCAWPTVAELAAPEAAGVHAIRLQANGGVQYAPLFVRGAGEVMFLASTFSYLAYANSVWASPSGAAMATSHPREVAAMRRYGLSTYSRHRDGSGVGLVSLRRPIFNATPGFLGEAIGGQVLLNDDLRIISWLDSLGLPYGLTTDHDLHAFGDAALNGCRVLVAGAHPEYHSTQSLDAIDRFVKRGGRLMYLGGNGFYWRVDTLPDAPHVMEIRRAEGGIRMWAEPEGEYYHQSDGALGGLWRRLGRAPNRLVGVGYSAQGDTAPSAPYQRTASAHDTRVAFAFEGVDPDALLGAEGPFGPAAGYELDRADLSLGTPPHALVVARSAPLETGLFPVNEERLTHTVLDSTDPLRADMTFFETPAGGAVFSAGSVMLAGVIETDPALRRVVTNVAARFADPAPFSMPKPDEEPSCA